MSFPFILGVISLLSIHYREYFKRMFLLTDYKKTGRGHARSQSRSSSHQNLRNSPSRTSRSSHQASTSESVTSKQRKPTNDETEKLNREFAESITKLERGACELPFREKSVATEWITKLKNVDANSGWSEMLARNEVAEHLSKCFHQRVFNSPPFNKPPPFEPFAIIKSKIPLSYKTNCLKPDPSDKKKYMSELCHSVYDDGEFLSQLPVPRDGAFFILHLRPQVDNN